MSIRFQSTGNTCETTIVNDLFHLHLFHIFLLVIYIQLLSHMLAYKIVS
jgi:hypothetical protein